MNFTAMVRMTALVFVGALVISACSLLPEERTEELPTLIEPPPSRMVTYEVQRGPIVEEMRMLGRVAPTLETEMYFRQSGRLAALYVSPGQQVAEGDLLAELEMGTLENQLEMAKIDLEIAKIRLDGVRMGVTPVDIRLQELAVEKSRLQVQNYANRIELATLRAPHDGTVQNVRAQVGQVIEEYDTVTVVADPGSREIQVEIRRVDDVNKISRDQKAFVEVRRDEWAPATVMQITERGTGATLASRTFIVHLQLDDEEALTRLRLGDLASVRLIVQERENALIIPRAALREFMGRRYVRLLDGDARREVDVEVGIMTPTEVEIIRGLAEGNVIIGQ